MIKKIFENFFFAALFLFACPLHAENFGTEFEREQQFYNSYSHYVSEVVASLTTQLEKEFNFRHGLGNIATRPTEKIEQLEFKFYIPRRATVDEARALMLAVLDRCAQAINSHEKIQPFLIERPFPKERVHISLYFEKRHDDYSSSYLDGSVTTAFASTRRFSYSAQTPFKSYIDLGEETFKEAAILAAKSPFEDLSVHQSTEMEEGLDKIFDQFSKEMEKKFDLRMDIGGNLTQGLWDIEINARMYHRATQKEARKLVILAAEKLSDQINSHFNESLFHPRRLKLKIDFIDKRHRNYCDGTIESVMLEGSEINYLTSEKQNLERYERELPKESYREALEIVENSSPDTLLEIVSKAIRDFWDGLISYIIDLWIGLCWWIAIFLGWGMK